MTASKNPVRRMDVTVSLREEDSAQEVIDKFYDFCQAEADLFVFQHEKTGQDNNHIQGRINYQKRMRTLAMAKKIATFLELDLKYVHVSPTANSTQNFSYVLKEEGRIAGPYSNKDMDCLCIQDPFIDKTRFVWQEFILGIWFDKFKKEMYNPTGRSILFVVDEDGGVGKSTLTKHCAISRQKDVCILPVTGSPAQLTSAIIDAGPYPYYILDMPRVKPVNAFVEDIMFVIEGLQNGLLVNSMYGKYKRLVMPNPQIVIFSNWKLPKCLSDDRYTYLYPRRFDKKPLLHESVRCANTTKYIDLFTVVEELDRKRGTDPDERQ